MVTSQKQVRGPEALEAHTFTERGKGAQMGMALFS